VIASRPTVLVLDTKDDRAQVRDGLRHLQPSERVDFLDWALDMARELAPPPVRELFAQAVADRGRMAPLVAAAERGDAVADVTLTGEIFLDLGTISHSWGIEFEPLILELEQWAKLKEVTPPDVAAVAWRAHLAGALPVGVGSVHTPGKSD